MNILDLKNIIVDSYYGETNTPIPKEIDKNSERWQTLIQLVNGNEELAKQMY